MEVAPGRVAYDEVNLSAACAYFNLEPGGGTMSTTGLVNRLIIEAAHKLEVLEDRIEALEVMQNFRFGK